MTQNNDIEKIEEIVDSFDIAMKKGFMSGLILLVLEKENCHGYLIKEKIDELTLGVWQPTVSTLYPLLKSLSDKALIECIELDDSGGRLKKVYKITKKGEETLKMLLQKHQMMIESVKSIVLSTVDIIDETEPSFVEDLEKLISLPGMELIKEKSIESKIGILKYNKEIIKKRIKILNSTLEEINNILVNLEKDSKNKRAEPQPEEIASNQLLKK
ncbi:MAG: PadR family transcriptional regulator [Candidatus Thorarchaeota archaeon]